MSTFTIKFGLFAIPWGLLLFGCLTIAQWPLGWNHSFCGPWGCGPPTQTLVASHAAWMVIIAPGLVWVARQRRRTRLYFAWIAATAGALGILAIFVVQGMVWLPEVAEWQRAYFWQRCGFCIANSIELPLGQLLIGAAIIFFLSIRPKLGSHFATHRQ